MAIPVKFIFVYILKYSNVQYSISSFEYGGQPWTRSTDPESDHHRPYQSHM